MESYYEYRHLVGFEETNLVGNVYYVNYLRWQGRCREMFLRERAPEVLAQVQDDLKLFTLKVECEFLAEITAFDELSIRMRLEDLTQTQIGFAFDYVKLTGGTEGAEGTGGTERTGGTGGPEILVARGRQRIACMRGPNGATRPAKVPEVLREALSRYRIAVPASRPAVPAPDRAGEPVLESARR